jgi:hypothetical protein
LGIILTITAGAYVCHYKVWEIFFRIIIAGKVALLDPILADGRIFTAMSYTGIDALAIGGVSAESRYTIGRSSKRACIYAILVYYTAFISVFAISRDAGVVVSCFWTVAGCRFSRILRNTFAPSIGHCLGYHRLAVIPRRACTIARKLLIIRTVVFFAWPVTRLSAWVSVVTSAGLIPWFVSGNGLAVPLAILWDAVLAYAATAGYNEGPPVRIVYRTLAAFIAAAVEYHTIQNQSYYHANCQKQEFRTKVLAHIVLFLGLFFRQIG